MACTYTLRLQLYKLHSLQLVVELIIRAHQVQSTFKTAMRYIKPCGIIHADWLRTLKRIFMLPIYSH